ncbi:serine/threonine-protein kinase Nek6-like isoform X1 [Anopheles moucheti]|uniref:serine/threonine-protein kinase Nek6-like isoform X1 n=1 Tax=Anopheles moucheti TaxID=186751 RepID=UPI0022F070DE|nr:serine/threonine-protein kinase Nek6-like isoform X1 [Anopheles moucheti]
MDKFSYSALHLHKILAEGCFGSSIGLYQYHNQYIVIKSIPYNSPDYAYKAVLKEHMILSQISHPRIIQYLGYFQTSDSWNIMLEFAEHGSLAAFLERRSDQRAFLNQHTVMMKFVDIADGLIYLHQKNVIHRDLKPANILISLDNRLKLADFGVSKIMHDNDFNRTIIGTPIYMAPEVARGKDYDYKSDVWALGIIFYELCMLEHPFVNCLGKSRKQKFRIPQIDYKGRGYSPSVQMLCDMMIQKDLSKRWTLENILKEFHVLQLINRTAT